jgi:hypothetical protein
MAVGDFTPELEDVGALLRARTKDTYGAELGTFDENTRPTAEEVTALINRGVAKVANKIGTNPCTDELKEQAKDLASLYTAMLVELSYFPEQIRSDRSPYDRYKELYDSGITDLAESVGELCSDNSSISAGTGGLSAYSFGHEELIGRETRW